jgi:hypothetical protein
LLFFFAVFFAAFLRFAIAALLAMKSWRCRISAHRESKHTAFRLLQHNEKSSVPLKEVCTSRMLRELCRAICTRSRDKRPFDTTEQEKNTAEFGELQKAIVESALSDRNDAAVLSIQKPLDALERPPSAAKSHAHGSHSPW